MTNPRLHLSITSELDRFSLDIEADFNKLTTGIFGVSGAGKTSIFKCLAGLHKGATGVIRFNNQDWLNSEKGVFVPAEHRRIGYVPQNGLLFPNKNVKENLCIASHRKRSDHSALSLQVVCQLLELNDLLERSTLSLSGGERQRVALGRALFSDPDLLLLDEPLSALDLQLKRQVLPFLQRIREELSIPMVMISHYPAEIQALCDDVLVIEQGKNVAFGAANDIFFRQQVLDLTHGEHYENIIPSIVSDTPSDSDQSTSLLHILSENSQYSLITSKTEVPPHGKLMVGIPADEIIIATQHPEGISAQNIIPVTIDKIEQASGQFMVCASLNNGVMLNAQISRESLMSLGLVTGKDVFFVIKSGACILYS